MRKTLTMLLLGWVVLPMAFVSVLQANNSPLKESNPSPKVKSNLSSALFSANEELMDFTVTASTATVSQNQQFCLDISVTNFDLIVGVEFIMNYNPNLLQFDAVQGLNLIGLSNNSFGRPGEDSNPLGQLKLSWFDNNVSGVTVADGTVIFQVCFTAITNDATAAITFSESEIIDGNLNDIPFNGVSSNITIGTGGSGTDPGDMGDFTLTLGDVNVQQGQQICVPVTVSNFTDIIGIEVLFNFNPAELQYNSVQGFNLEDLGGNAFGGPDDTGNAGVLKLSWVNQDLEGVTVLDGTAIFEICFTALASNTVSNITMSGDEIVDNNTQVIDFVGSNGSVTIGSGGNNGGGSDDFTITVSDETVAQGEDVCVEVSVDNFDDLLGLEVIFNYNPSELQYNAVQSFNLSGLSGAAFNELGGVGTPSGQLKLSWFDNNVAGITVADGTVIFEICFTALAASGSDEITMTEEEVIDGNQDIIPLNKNSGTVTFGSGNPGVGDFEIIMSDATVQAGQSFCLGTTVNDFTNISGVGFTIDYDPALLDFTEVKNLNLSELSTEAFGLPGQGGNQAGSIVFSWFSMAASGVSTADGTVIFETCFTALNTAASTDVSFTSLEVIDQNTMIAPSSSQAGTVTIQGGNTGGSDDLTLRIDDAMVNAGADFCVPFRVDNFEAISGMGFTINYDPTKLEFVEVKDFNLTELNASAFGTPLTSTQPGEIILSWFEQSGNGATVVDGTAIFNLCFKAIGSGTSDVSINPSGLEVIDNNSTLVQGVVSESGTVDISGIAPSDDLQFIFSNKTAANGEEVCVEVSVNNFDQIVGLEFIIEYDPAELQYKELKNLNLDQLSTASFGPPGTGSNPLGALKLSWLDQNVQGISVPDGTVIMEVCFTVLGDQGTTSVGIDEEDFVEIIDGDQNEAPYQTRAGIVTISDAPPLTLSTPAVITGLTCFGGTDGAIDISIQGGTGSYSYSWDYQNSISEDLSGLPSGQYGLTVTDNGSTQTFTQTFNVPGPTAVSIDNAAVNNINCRGEMTGTINITASGGTGTLSYTWDNSLPAAANLSGLGAGMYALTVTDSLGCTTNDTYTITEPDAVLTLSRSVSNETCPGQNDGGITLMVNGGTTPYSFSWGNGLTGDVMSQSNVGAGMYPVTVTDANGCEQSTVVVLNSDPSVTIMDSDVTYIDADNNTGGAIDLSLDGVGTPYTFLWTGPASFVAITEDITNLTAIGEYCVRITDNGNCVLERCFMVLERLAFTDAIINNSCSSTGTGSVDVEIEGGLAPYSYLWSNGAISQDLMNVVSGNYSVTVTDSLGNSFNGLFPVSALPAISVAETVTSVMGDSTNNNGSISVFALGGAPGYSYLWSTGATTSSLTNLAPGEYCITVTDQNGCTEEECYTVGVIALPLAYAGSATDIDCNGESTGTASIEITGGAPPYVITFADNMTMSSMTGQITRNNLPGGDLRFVITDSENTTLEGTVTVNEASAITLANVQVVHDVDAQGCTGSIIIGVSGGTPGYMVQWNAPNGGFQIIGLCEGNYIPTIQDATGCTVTFDPIFLNTFTVAEQVNNAECRDDTNGSIRLNTAGGSGEYTYRWENSAGDLVSEADSLVNVAAGTYAVTITESSGNTITKTIEVGTNSMLEASVAIDTNYRGFGVSCSDSNDGILSATADNGAGDYVYVWMQGDQIVGSGTTVEGLGAGDYVLEVTDANGCMITEAVSLSAPPVIQVTGFTTNPNCIGERNGEITVSASGGTGGFGYSWSNQVASPNVSFLTQGRYTVTVSDDNNCEAVEFFDLEDPAAIQVNVETAPATDGCNGSARAMVSGGVEPYIYRWSTASVSTDAILTGLCPGDYAVEVTDARGCSTNPEMVIAEVFDRRFPCMDVRPVITPDGDGLNEEFLINCIEELNDNRLLIYNRWGQLVFETQNYQNDWRGETGNGERLPEGAYYFVLEYNDNQGNFVQTKGSITLLREE